MIITQATWYNPPGMGKLNTDFLNAPEITIREEEDGSYIVVGHTDDLKEHKKEIDAFISKQFQKKYNLAKPPKHSKPRR